MMHCSDRVVVEERMVKGLNVYALGATLEVT